MDGNTNLLNQIYQFTKKIYTIIQSYKSGLRADSDKEYKYFYRFKFSEFYKNRF